LSFTFLSIDIIHALFPVHRAILRQMSDTSQTLENPHLRLECVTKNNSDKLTWREYCRFNWWNFKR